MAPPRDRVPSVYERAAQASTAIDAFYGIGKYPQDPSAIFKLAFDKLNIRELSCAS